MKSLVSVRSISGASSKGMIDHVKGCLKDVEPDSILIHHGTNDLKYKQRKAKDIADNIINLAITVKKDVKEVFFSGLTFRNDKWNEKREKGGKNKP